ncbi:MAG: dioxygenase [Gammaproteobacteria bacterium]|nr:dioxygenase [Gammaproteobacteria bacterium]MBT4492791.1 dioxygenase [Gammaproteobacteria bacterium]MBT7370026.1 dioxygenase [Gammaproteobacteria bacterium]
MSAVSETELQWHLQGNWAPVFDEVDGNELEVVGEVPRELNGVYIRNGMNPKSGHSDHWFFGDGMLHGVTFEDGRVSYRNRYVRTPAYLEEAGADGGLGDLANSKANTHIVRHAGKVLALEEGHLPWLVDEQLNTIGPYDFAGRLKGSMTAHPRICPETGEMMFFGYSMMAEPYLTYHRANAAGELVQTEVIDIPNPVMMHDWNVSRNYVIFMDLPLVFDLEAAMKGESPFGFKPEVGARLGVMPRDGGNADVRWFDIDPCYVFHPMNAHEEGDKLVLYVCRLNSAMRNGMDDMYSGDESLGKMTRWTIDLKAGTVQEERLDDAPIDFPRVDDRTIGMPSRFGYAMGLDPNAQSLTFDRYLYKYELATGGRDRLDLGKGVRGAEPVFAARTPESVDDDGFVLSLAHDENRNQSKFLVMDAQNFSGKPLAEILLPQRVPYGAHGSWMPDS